MTHLSKTASVERFEGAEPGNSFLQARLPIRYVENEWRRRTYLQGIYDTWIFGQRRNNVCLPRGLYKDRVGYLRAGMAVQ